MTETNNTPTPPPTEWEERYEDLLKQTLTANPLALLNQTGGLIKTFITQALAEQKARMVEVVEGFKKRYCVDRHEIPMAYCDECWVQIKVNGTCDDIIKALSK